MIAVPAKAVPRTSYEVRRRRYDATPWLVRHNEWYELDELTDAVWLLCAEALCVADIARELAVRRALPLREALAVTVHALIEFRDRGLLELDVDEYGAQTA